jgi:hypothetical protein
MSGFPNGGPWPAITKEVSKPNRRAITAVISYVGKDAPTLLPLRKGDWLVCDASPLAIRQQLSSTEALLKFHRKGVVIFSVQGLHAKVVSSPTSAWIGSANASNNSATNLIEASIRVTGAQARNLHSWAVSLATEDCVLSLKELKVLDALPRIAMRPGPNKTEIPTQIPTTWKSMWFLHSEPDTSVPGSRRVQADRDNAEKAARALGQSSLLSSIRYTQKIGIKVGDWAIEVSSGHVRTPGYVVRVKENGGEQIVWISRIKMKQRPSIAQLRAQVPQLNGFKTEIRIREVNQLAKIRSLYE